MTQTGSIYGESLYSLAAEEKAEKAILDELAVLKQSFTAEPDFIRLLCPRQSAARFWIRVSGAKFTLMC